MIELLLGLSLQFSDPCGVVQDWRDDVTSCVVSTVPSVTVAGITLNNPVFTTTDNESANSYGLGGIAKFDLGPLATSGYYSYGAAGVCINPDGSLIATTEVGSAADMFPPDHYMVQSRNSTDDLGYTVGFNLDPCLSPKTRGAVLFLAHSTQNPHGDVSAAGFDGYRRTLGGVTSKGVPITLQYEVLSAPAYHTAGTIQYKVTLTTGTVAGTGGSWCSNVGSSLGAAWNFNGSADLCGVGTGFFGDSSTGHKLRSEVVLSLPVTASFNGISRVNQYPSGPFANQATITYRQPGTPGAAEAPSGSGLAAKAFVVRSSALDAVPFVPVETQYESPEWVCDTWECVTDQCDGVDALDFGGFFKCVFIPPDFSMGDLVDSFKESITGWGPYQLIEYANGIILSLGYAIGAKDGGCGQLFDLGDSLYGVSYSTCGTSSPPLIHTVGQAGVYIAALMALVRVLLAFVQTGKVLSYFGVRSS